MLVNGGARSSVWDTHSEPRPSRRLPLKFSERWDIRAQLKGHSGWEEAR